MKRVLGRESRFKSAFYKTCAVFEHLEPRRLLSSVSLVSGVIRGGDPHDGYAEFDPPDSMGAVSPSYVVQFINGEFRVIAKSGGVSPTSDVSFWSAAGISSPQHLSDPRIIYDPLVGRFIATEMNNAGQSSGTSILLGISAGANPNVGSWRAVSFSDPVGSDFPTLGVDANGVYICANVFPNSGGLYQSLYAFPTADVMWTGANYPSLAHLFANTFQNLPAHSGTTGTIQPAVDFTPNKPITSREFFLFNAGGSEAWISGFGGYWNGVGFTPEWNDVNIDVKQGYSLPVVAPQPGTHTKGSPYLDDGDGRLTDVTVVNGNFWTIMPASFGGYDGAIVAELQITPSKESVIQSQSLWAPGSYFLYPSIAVDSNNDIGIGATYTDASTYPSACITGRLATDPPGTWAGITIAERGIDNYSSSFFRGDGGAAWGDYSMTVVDPSDATLFWTEQEDVMYPDSSFPNSNNWTTMLESFRISSGGASAITPSQSIETSTSAGVAGAPVVTAPSASASPIFSDVQVSNNDVVDAIEDRSYKGLLAGIMN